LIRPSGAVTCPADVSDLLNRCCSDLLNRRCGQPGVTLLRHVLLLEGNI
jgi:hypothetical protein